MLTDTMHLRWHLDDVIGYSLTLFCHFLPLRYFFVTSLDFQRCILSGFIWEFASISSTCSLCHGVWNMLHFRRSSFCLWAFLWGWDTCDGWKWASRVSCVSCVSRPSCLLTPGTLVGVAEAEQTPSNWCAGRDGQKYEQQIFPITQRKTKKYKEI